MTLLQGRTAIVTGASAGLGRQFAQVLADQGASLVIVARRTEELEALSCEIAERGGRSLVHSADLADASAIEPLFVAAEERFGTADILVNNAAVADANYATELSLDRIDRVIDLDFRAPFLLSVELARRLIAAEKPGRIVNLSSVGAYHYTPRSAAALYCAVKAGIVRMTERLAIEWAHHGINVNAIAPGMFESEMTEGYIAEVGDGNRKPVPRRRIGLPPDLDSTLLYLVDPPSHFVTGTCILVDDAQTSR